MKIIWNNKDGSPSKKTKLKNQRVFHMGIAFDSKHEATVYEELFFLEKAGEIKDLKTQQAFPLTVNESEVCSYVADFTYLDGKQKTVVEAKGYWTDLAKLKMKLFKFLYPDWKVIIKKRK